MSKSRGRVIGGVVALALLIACFVVWRTRSGGHATTAAAKQTPVTKVTIGSSGPDPTTGAPRWFGQRGVSGRRIAGVVVGEDRRPLKGATVRLASIYTMAGLIALPSKVTDDAGQFDFGAQLATTYLVSAEVPTLTASLLRLDLRDVTLQPAPDQLRLVMHACTTAIHGTINDTAGGPIAGATIARADRDLTTRIGVDAGADGSYELCLPPGGEHVVVSADGYAAIAENVNVYGKTRRDFRLIPGAPVLGRVIRGDDKSAIEGAIIDLRSTDPRTNTAPLSATSDAEGKFHFDAVTPGRHNITAHADHLSTPSPVEVIAELGTPPLEVVVALDASYVVSGTMKLRGTGKPVAGRAAYLRDGRAGRFETRPHYAMTQVDGTFAIDRVAPGTYRVTTQGADTDVSPSVTVEHADVTGVVLEVNAGASVSGRVLYDGKPVDGAMVRAGTRNMQQQVDSDADGNFQFHDLPAGELQLYSESHVVGAFTSGPKLTLAEGEDRKGVDLVLDLSGSIAGTVVDQNDAPVGGVFLTFSLLHGRDFGSATTADDGSFTAHSLSGGGEYVYEVRQRDQSPLVFPPVAGKRFPPIAVKDGATHISGVRIKIKYERLAISGRVTDPTGKPVPDATVSVQPRVTSWFSVPTATSDQSGAFALRDLPGGTYNVTATTGRGEAHVENVEAGRSDVALRMTEPGGIDGTLSGFKGTPEVIAYRLDSEIGRYRGITGTVTGTTFQLRNLPAGRYKVTASTGSDSATTTVDVAVGVIRTVKLAVGAVGTVVGTVVDAKTHAGVAGMHCIAALQAADEVDYTQRNEVTSDAKGAFRIERAPAGEVVIGCYGQAGSGFKQATVVAGQVLTIEITSSHDGRSDGDHKADVGLELEDQLGEVFVKSVTPGGAAARAGILVGDVIVSVDGRTIGRYQSDMALSLMQYQRPDGEPTKVVVERDDKQLTVLLKPAPLP